MKKNLLWKGLLCCIILFTGLGWLFVIHQNKDTLPVSYSGKNLLRLHVLANSDSPIDQQLKLKVRDAIIAYLAPYLNHTTEKAVAKKVVLEQQANLIQIAEQTLRKNGATYPVSIEVGIFDFPIKSYGNLVLPAGKYEAVRILIGNAEGKNWWCVLFPPLCFVDITNGTAIPTKDLINNPE